VDTTEVGDDRSLLGRPYPRDQVTLEYRLRPLELSSCRTWKERKISAEPQPDSNARYLEIPSEPAAFSETNYNLYKISLNFEYQNFGK
jgi:hypothetical protein